MDNSMVGWPKGKPRGPQSAEHKAKIAKANTEGQLRSYANDPTRRQRLSEGMHWCWEFGARYADRRSARGPITDGGNQDG